jgi:monolysocardiolipin acyltransferase
VCPIVRGDGIYQRGMERAVQHLMQNKWFHVFPEGKCVPELARAYTIAPLRWGVGRLVGDLALQGKKPIVLPWVHRGMETVMPLYHRIPRIGNHVRVVVGEEIEYDDIIEWYKALSRTKPDSLPLRELLYAKITDRIQGALQRAMDELKSLDDQSNM